MLSITGFELTFMILMMLDSYSGFVRRLARRVPHVEQELLTVPERLCSVPVFSGVCVALSFVL